jgi:hypothetical protein
MLGVGLERGGLPRLRATGAVAEERGEQPLLAGVGTSFILPLAVDDLNNVFIHEHRCLSFLALAGGGRWVTGESGHERLCYCR